MNNTEKLMDIIKNNIEIKEEFLDILENWKTENLKLFIKNNIEIKTEFWYILQNYTDLDSLKKNNLITN